MSIATTKQYWTSRMLGEDPSDLTQGQDNESFTLSGAAGDGVASDGAWVISSASGGQTWALTPATTDYTMVCALHYAVAPTDTTVLMKLDNGTYSVQVESTGDLQTLRLVGSTSVVTRELDLARADEFEPVTLILRLTLDAAGNARLYMREIIEDDDGAINYVSVTGSAGSSATVQFGNTDGTVHWHTVYISNQAAFDPDEMATSDFTTNTLLQLGLSIVQTIKDSQRMYLKTQVDDSSVVYGFDISSDRVSRIAPPSIHVVLSNVQSPNFSTLGGTRIEQMYDVQIFITTRGTDYKNAYRMGMEIVGEIFDELYTETGLKGTTDSIVSYEVDLDTKRDNDDVLCVHRLVLTYMRRLNMLHR